MATDAMPDGRPMHPPCTCPECSDGPGIDYGDSSDRTARMISAAAVDRVARQQRLTKWREDCHNGS